MTDDELRALCEAPLETTTENRTALMEWVRGKLTNDYRDGSAYEGFLHLFADVDGLLAARTALPRLLDERDAARKAVLEWDKSAHRLKAERDGLRMKASALADAADRIADLIEERDGMQRELTKWKEDWAKEQLELVGYDERLKAEWSDALLDDWRTVAEALKQWPCLICQGRKWLIETRTGQYVPCRHCNGTGADKRATDALAIAERHANKEGGDLDTRKQDVPAGLGPEDNAKPAPDVTGERA